MDKPRRLRTYPIKSLTIFVAICFVVSLAMVILFAFLNKEEWVIRILIFIFCGLFTVASAIILIYQLFFYVSVDEDNFYRHVMFGKHTIPLNKIERIINRDGFYEVIVKGRKITSFSTNTKEGQQIIVFLERKGVKIDW